MSSKNESLARWRLVLGRYAERRLGGGLGGRQQRVSKALDWLYGREYQGRGVRQRPEKGLGGGLGPTALNVPGWLSEVRELFPQETVEVIQKHALDRYGMKELLTDPEVLETLEPNIDLVKTIMSFKGMMNATVLAQARRIVRQVVDEIRRRLEQEVRRVLSGRMDRFSHSRLRVHQNLDWRATIRANLKHWDGEHRRLVIHDVRFFSRIQRRLPWTVILCVDQSGSMAGSVIHSAVMAGILAGLPLVTPKLVVFDTSVVDLTRLGSDPVEVLMSVQLGGGTDIGQALCYCEKLVEDPRRTVLVLVSDFCEGAAPGRMLGAVERMKEAGITLLGLAALDEAANPWFDGAMAQKLADRGMEIAAVTPYRLAEWLATVIS